MMKIETSSQCSALMGAAAAICLSLTGTATSFADVPTTSWRYYRPGNTGIQGDYNEAIFIGADNDPWIGGYDPSFEEGGIAKFIQAENRWVNISNVDYPVIGHPDVTGTTRISDMVQDAQGRLWMATWRGCLRMDPAVGPSTLVNLAAQSSALFNGNCHDLDIAPDGTVWFALVGFGGAMGGLIRHTPATNDWHFWTGGNPPQGGNGWPVLAWVINNVSVQPKPSGGYIVWCEAHDGGSTVWFDSDTQQFTRQEFSFTPGSMYQMPGKDCVDDSGNFWMTRFAGFVGGGATYSLDYRRPDGTWVSPPQPAAGTDIWAFRAFGNLQALAVDGTGRVRRFNGTSWVDYGVWRDGSYTNDVNIDGLGNVWASGTGGAARRDVATGQWQRYRVTNTSQYDLWNNDLSIDPTTGNVYACANAGGGFGGMTRFDGTRWTGYNIGTYGLGESWPFPTDNSEAVAFRASNGEVAVNPMYDAIHQHDGASWSDLGGPTTAEGLAEDSNGRLWCLGEYFDLRYRDGAGWHTVPNNGAWGNNLEIDPDRAGTVWASTYAEVIRTDGSYRYSRTYHDFPQLDTQSDIFGTVAPGPNGTAWLGSTKGMFHLDANTGTYTYHTSLGGRSCMGGSPIAVTPDGRVWWAMFDPYGTGLHGLCWWDGTTSGIFNAPRNGGPQWGGLPHAQLYAWKVRELASGYELWLSCASRGIAVLTVSYQNPADVVDGSSAPTLRLVDAGPNPFRRATTLAFALPQAAEANLGIFDVGGRQVRRLLDGRVPAGRSEVTWDGLSDAREPVPSGVYFWRLESGGEVATRRTVRVE
ncbi:MAG: hypothetical protein IT349_08840 [Candidatus Eisenbacteria bacterium]|nr:hypothetical protein [Candidatus Eisenbacteria bacterium]